MSTAVSTAQMHSRVQEFVSRPRKMFIDGKWVEAASGKTFPPITPLPEKFWRRLPKAIARTSIAR